MPKQRHLLCCSPRRAATLLSIETSKFQKHSLIAAFFGDVVAADVRGKQPRVIGAQRKRARDSIGSFTPPMPRPSVSKPVPLNIAPILLALESDHLIPFGMVGHHRKLSRGPMRVRRPLQRAQRSGRSSSSAGDAGDSPYTSPSEI